MPSTSGAVRVQDIAGAEEEAAKSRVGAAAAGKQAEKLRKESAKTDADAAKAEADIAARKAEQKVGHVGPYHELWSITTCCGPVKSRKELSVLKRAHAPVVAWAIQKGKISPAQEVGLSSGCQRASSRS